MTESPPDPRSRAASALAARRRQIHALRLRVITLAVSIFIAAWAVVFVQLVKGHDPALASTNGSVVTQSADPAATADDESTGSSTSTSSASSSEESSGSSGATASSPTAVTTRQS